MTLHIRSPIGDRGFALSISEQEKRTERLNARLVEEWKHQFAKFIPAGDEHVQDPRKKVMGAATARWPEEATDDLLVEFESIRDDQGKTSEIHPPRKVAKQSVSVPVASPSRHRRWPEPRPDLDRNEDPTRRLLVARERANLVGLKLFGSEASDPSVIESTTHLGCLLEPAGDGVPGNPFDPGNRGNADTLDSESDDPIESSSSMLETVVGRAFRRRERLAALAAPVSTAFPGPRSVESVVNNASGTDCSIRRTCGIETSAILHFGSALTMRELCLQNSGSNSSTRTGYAAATNTSWRKHHLFCKGMRTHHQQQTAQASNSKGLRLDSN